MRQAQMNAHVSQDFGRPAVGPSLGTEITASTEPISKNALATPGWMPWWRRLEAVSSSLLLMPFLAKS